MDLYYLFKEQEKCKDDLDKAEKAKISRDWTKENPEKRKAANAKWYKENGKEYSRNYYKNNLKK